MHFSEKGRLLIIFCTFLQISLFLFLSLPDLQSLKMVSSNDSESLIYDVRLSSVVPASVTGEDKVYELTNMDLAMKLHYIKGLYFFNSDATHGLTICDLKAPMFWLLERCSAVSGRIRRDEDGKPFIRCNDSGVRIVEAKCNKTIHEWLDSGDSSLDDHLVYSQVLGPDLGFTPLVYIQFTLFKCGGISVGVSYAHVLGDVFSASDFINMWGKIIKGDHHDMNSKFLDTPNPRNFNFQSSIEKNISFALKKVDPVGDHWKFASNLKMQTHTFHITTKQLNHLSLKVIGSLEKAKITRFEVISAIIWKSLAKIREELETKVVTICRKGFLDNKHMFSSNKQVISIVKANSRVFETDPLELAKLIAEKSIDETSMIGEVMEKERNEDFIMYGANLSFIDLEEANIYGLELKGQKPIFAYYSLSGVGHEGAILVQPGPGNGNKEDENSILVNVILLENQIVGLKDELWKEWSIC